MLDYGVFLGYMAGVLLVGLITSTKVHNSSDLFTAGRQAPWWISGLSSYMTMFSAATFVVWGGVAYRYGLVAVVINLTYGIAAILVGFFLAGRWRSLGISTAAQFVELRFGKAALTGYTVLNLTTKMITVAVGLYALAVMICALMPLADGNLLQDTQTGNLSVAWTILLLGGFVVLFTVAGGLWAVLVTDAVQFIIIMIAVCFVVPLIVERAGGLDEFFVAAPIGFFQPARDEWSWWILAGWCGIHFMMIGAEWAFVQRYLCVPDRQAARKSAWLFGALYLLSPLVWMLPPMVYRTINPSADPEQAYILACQAVLPPGMIGLMLAAMAAATLSGIDTQLNMFAGVLTNDFYRCFVKPSASEANLVKVGRIATFALGGLLIALALVAPRWGGAEALIVKVGSLCVGPLLLPSIWGLFSRKLNSAAMWITVAVCIAAGLTVFALQNQVVEPADGGALIQFTRWLQTYPRHADMIVGLILPVLVLGTMELGHRQISPGWERVTMLPSLEGDATSHEAAIFPLRVMGWSLVGSGALMASLIYFDKSHAIVLTVFAAALLGLGAAALSFGRKLSRVPTSRNPQPVLAPGEGPLASRTP